MQTKQTIIIAEIEPCSEFKRATYTESTCYNCGQDRARHPQPEPEPPAVIPDPMYGSLAGVLQLAHDHAARGKGHDRHGDDDTPFLEQPTMQIARMIGAGYPAGQIMKKADEAKRMVDRGQYDAAVSEFLGVINYAAAAILLIREL